MKKWVCFLALLAVASLTLLIAAHVSLYRQRDRVEIYQETLAGDPAAAEGITVTFHDRQSDQLFWDSAIPLGTAEPQAETDFRFCLTPQREGFAIRYAPSIEFWGASGISDRQGDPAFDELWERMYGALAEDAPLGEERTVTGRLRDYCDYLPLRIISLSSEPYSVFVEDTENEAAAARELARYLNVVPSDDWTLEITYADYGDSQSSGAVTNLAPPRVLAQATEQGLYLCLRTDRPDMLQCRDGVGLWFVPFRDTGRTVTCYPGNGAPPEKRPIVTLDVSRARVAYPYDPYEAEPLALERSEDGKDLLLYLREGEDLVLLAVDAASGQVRQELTLAEDTAKGSDVFFVDAAPSGWIAALSTGPFALVTEEAGRYALACSGVLEAPEGAEGYGRDFRWNMMLSDNCPRALWDGERLTWVSLAAGIYNIHLGFYAAVFDRQGAMTYLGKYATSRGRGGNSDISGTWWWQDAAALELSSAP